MTTTTLPHPNPVKLAVCPAWCLGHDTHFQPWYDADEGQVRDHADDGATVKPASGSHADEVTVDVVRREDAVTGMNPSVVGLYVSGHMDLTPAEARGVAANLLEKADRAEAHQ